MLNQKYYTCEYCYSEYVPKRRGVQRFCSNSCRSNAHRVKNKHTIVSGESTLFASTLVQKKKKGKKKKKNSKKEKISFHGVGNAAIGTLATNIISKALTKDENLPATKGDLQALRNSISRYQKVENMQPDENGKLPYFDMETKTVVFLLFQ